MDKSNENASQRTYQNLTTYRLLHVTPLSPFYEEYGVTAEDEPYLITEPDSWTVSEDNTWKYYFPPSANLPMQGWKIHVSACPGNDSLVLQRVSVMLFNLNVAFKHLVSKRSFMQANMKHANRASSGKFITVYPFDDEQFCYLLEEIDKLTDEFEGPYILSDT